MPAEQFVVFDLDREGGVGVAGDAEHFLRELDGLWGGGGFDGTGFVDFFAGGLGARRRLLLDVDLQLRACRVARGGLDHEHGLSRGGVGFARGAAAGDGGGGGGGGAEGGVAVVGGWGGGGGGGAGGVVEVQGGGFLRGAGVHGGVAVHGIVFGKAVGGAGDVFGVGFGGFEAVAEEGGAFDDAAADHAHAFDGGADDFAGGRKGAREGGGALAGAGYVVWLEEHFQADHARFAVEAKGDFLRAEGLEEVEVDIGVAEEVVRVAHVPVEDAEAEFGGCARVDGALEEFVPGWVKSFLLDLGLVDLLVVQLEFAVRVTEAVTICCWQVGGVQNVDAKSAHVVNAFAWIKLHLDG